MYIYNPGKYIHTYIYCMASCHVIQFFSKKGKKVDTFIISTSHFECTSLKMQFPQKIQTHDCWLTSPTIKCTSIKKLRIDSS